MLPGLVADRAARRELTLDPLFVEAFGRVLADAALDGSLKSLALVLPSERDLALAMDVIDPDGIHEARRFVRRSLASALCAGMTAKYEETASTAPYTSDKPNIDRRWLRNTVLAYLSTLEEPETTKLVHAQFEGADNMTEVQAALSILADLDVPERTEALDAFYAQWQADPLVLHKWFIVQAMSSHPGLSVCPAQIRSPRTPDELCRTAFARECARQRYRFARALESYVAICEENPDYERAMQAVILR